MVISSEPVWGEAINYFVQKYENAVVYGDID